MNELLPRLIAADEIARAARPHEMNRAIADLRCGDFVLLRDGDRATLIQAAETADDGSLARAVAITGCAPVMAVTRRRAAALGLCTEERGSEAVELVLAEAGPASRLNQLADPTLVLALPPDSVTPREAPADGTAAAAIELARLARLLPATVMFAMSARAAELVRQAGIVELGIATVFEHGSVLARTLRRVVDARVPLADAEEARIVAFRPDDGGTDHLAILIGEPDPTQPVLTRVHSECFTGDLLASLRCECGEQLRGAIRVIAESGGGVLVYLAQEGRGIGLVNKLRAYRLQDAGFDTVDANEQLGFAADERVYQPAAEMLRDLGFTRVRLLTNNPDKVAALARHGIEVIERVPHAFAANAHNRDYLRTKAVRSGHLF
ncbi:MAG TPA: GTP cyclohydrolase II [Stellaceae bacterium]|nr:GTP cyclohydrolase II [Stellaceae bacterium]